MNLKMKHLNAFILKKFLNLIFFSFIRLRVFRNLIDDSSLNHRTNKTEHQVRQTANRRPP